jgi:hypothetical protein
LSGNEVRRALWIVYKVSGQKWGEPTFVGIYLNHSFFQRTKFFNSPAVPVIAAQPAIFSIT